MKINGVKVVDATRSIRLHISPQDTKVGAVKDPGACAAAVCCMREVKSCTAARIHLGRAYLRVGDKWVRYFTSLALRSEIVAFDRGGTFEAGEYLLSKPYKAMRLGHMGGSTKFTPKRPNHTKSPRKLAVRHVTTNVRRHGASR